MKLVKFQTGDAVRVGILDGQRITPLQVSQVASLGELLELPDPAAVAEAAREADSIALDDVELLPPIDTQEVWAAGVTYKRSQAARMEESEAAASCYDRVYASPRPELFMKATPRRVSGPGQPLRIRVDSEWNVPEPELALVINSRNELVGCTVGNDMSSRDIEGENPLYLPQAKVYDQCCGLGPCVTLAAAMPANRAEIGIRLTIRRDGEVAFAGETNVDQMARTFDDLISWLVRDNTMPAGAFLLTGTGVVPASDFTLLAGDTVDIEIDGIGVLSNPIVQG